MFLNPQKLVMKGREGKGREGKGGKERDGKGRKGMGREGKGWGGNEPTHRYVVRTKPSKHAFLAFCDSVGQGWEGEERDGKETNRPIDMW